MHMFRPNKYYTCLDIWHQSPRGYFLYKFITGFYERVFTFRLKSLIALRQWRPSVFRLTAPFSETWKLLCVSTTPTRPEKQPSEIFSKLMGSRDPEGRETFQTNTIKIPNNGNSSRDYPPKEYQVSNNLQCWAKAMALTPSMTDVESK